MNQSVAQVVVRQEGQGGIALRAMEAEGPDRPYSQLPAPSVAKRLEYRSSQKKEDQFIAAIAIARSEQLIDVKSVEMSRRAPMNGSPSAFIWASGLCRAML